MEPCPHCGLSEAHVQATEDELGRMQDRVKRLQKDKEELRRRIVVLRDTLGGVS